MNDRSAVNVRHAESAAPAGGSSTPCLSPVRREKVVRLIDACLDQRVTIAILAAQVHLSPFHFARSFRKTLGMTPHLYLTMRRIEKAKELLAREGTAIAQIARMVGFRTQSHFTGVFRQMTGEPPGRYRRRVDARAAPAPGP